MLPADDTATLIHYGRERGDFTPTLERALLAIQPADSEEYDDPRFRLAFQIGASDIEAAIGWAQSIVGEQKRTMALRAVAHNWSVADPVAAGAWVREELRWSDEDVRKHLPR